MTQADIDVLVTNIASALPGSTTDPLTIPQFRDRLQQYRGINSNVLRKHLSEFLARVTPERIEDLTAYKYLVEAPTLEHPDVKPRWAGEFKPAAVLFDSVPNEMSAAFNPYLRKHLAVHALGREGEIVMPSASAVFEFKTSSRRVGSSIGIPPGLCPLNILST